jgi:cephalosporin hydroxylase
MTLVELLNQNDHYFVHGGSINRTDKELRHSYCSLVYENLFAPYRDKTLNILEIGICHGGSLILWNDYFPNATIIGVDNDDQTAPPLKLYNRISTHFVDAYSDNFANTINDIDILIDDGPHSLDSQLQCIDLYLHKVRSGGLFIIEDIRSIDNANKLIEKVKHLNYELHDSTSETGNHDNNVLIVRK